MQPVIKRKGKVIGVAQYAAPGESLSSTNIPINTPTNYNSSNASYGVGVGAAKAKKKIDEISKKYGDGSEPPVLSDRLVKKYARKQARVDKRNGRSTTPIGVNQRLAHVASNIERREKGGVKKPRSVRYKRDMQKVLKKNK